MKPIAIIIPWFGKKNTGGAEKITWQIAHRLTKRGYDIEVLTTCCESFLSPWDTNHYRPGKESEDGLIIRRFGVDQRKVTAFNEVNQMLITFPKEKLVFGCPPLAPKFEKIFLEENINSKALLQHLREKKTEYHAFIFIPYPYGPTLKGLPLVQDRAILQPCLHNESYAYLSVTETIFRQAKYILFNTEEEMKLARLMYGPGIMPRSLFIGTGVQIPEIPAKDHSYLSQIPSYPYLLYLGMRCPQKHTDYLVDCFKHYQRENPESELKLILCGSGKDSYQDQKCKIIDLGYISEGEKQNLLKNCLALVNPSIHESYSLVIMEAWLFQKPVIVHGDCSVTARMVKKSGGGLIADTISSWSDSFKKIGEVSELDLQKMGEKGHAYAQKYTDWEKVIDRYERVFLKMKKKNIAAVRPEPKKTIHQILPNFTTGDAISRQAFYIRDYLIKNGYQSEIYAYHLGSNDIPAQPFQPDPLWEADGLIYHHSIGSEMINFVHQYEGKKALIYHNVTPENYFYHNKTLASKLKKGRLALKTLSDKVPLAYGDSCFNKNELVEAGFKISGVLPIMIEPEIWNLSVNAEVMGKSGEGYTNIIFVGRIAPNKCQHHLIEAFVHYRKRDPESNLYLIGYYEADDPYYQYLLSLIMKNNIHDRVFITGKVDQHQLHAYYRMANLFWSMSEHEGFGVPLIESMWFDIPVMAYQSAAIPETLRKAGILFTEKRDLDKLSEIAFKVIHNKKYQKKILAGQRQRRKDFLPKKIHPQLRTFIDQLESQKQSRRKVAFIVQRCGEDVNGGAEILCLQLAETMKNLWDIEILTTCARDYITWRNYYPRGKDKIAEINVHRFPVDQSRDINIFKKISNQLYDNLEESDISQQENWMFSQGPVSGSFLKFLKKNRNRYDAFIFFTYLYATTYLGLPLVAHKSVLVPTAHDELMIKMKIWDHFFKLPRGYIFLSDGEKDFLIKRFPNTKLSGPIAKILIKPPPKNHPISFRKKYKINNPYILYLGRIDARKGCLELINFFINYYNSNSSCPKLMLIGRESMTIPKHPAIIKLGYVDDKEKWDALSGCEWLVNPSPYESLSIVLLEAWSVRRPVLVTEKCQVLVNQCRHSQGGLWYNGYNEFEKILLYVKDWEKDQMGNQGYTYVKNHHQKTKIIRQMQESIGRIVNQKYD